MIINFIMIILSISFNFMNSITLESLWILEKWRVSYEDPNTSLGPGRDDHQFSNGAMQCVALKVGGILVSNFNPRIVQQ